MIVLLILFSSLLIISIKLSIDRTITSKSDKALTVAVLSSSLSNAISQNISQEFSSAILDPQIDIDTLPVFIIYHSQFDSSHSIIIISPSEYFLSSHCIIIPSITSWSIHLNISKL
jgi:hypothetical protein